VSVGSGWDMEMMETLRRARHEGLRSLRRDRHGTASGMPEEPQKQRVLLRIADKAEGNVYYAIFEKVGLPVLNTVFVGVGAWLLQHYAVMKISEIIGCIFVGIGTSGFVFSLARRRANENSTLIAPIASSVLPQIDVSRQTVARLCDVIDERMKEVSEAVLDGKKSYVDLANYIFSATAPGSHHAIRRVHPIDQGLIDECDKISRDMQWKDFRLVSTSVSEMNDRIIEFNKGHDIEVARQLLKDSDQTILSSVATIRAQFPSRFP
jgi:hypothetical protein